MSRLLQRLRRAGCVVLLLSILAPCEAQYRHAAEVNRGGVPEWKEDPELPHDMFHFVRVHYSTNPNRRRGWYGGGWGGEGRRGPWYIDAPDADLNLAFRLHEMTSLRVFDGETDITLDDPKLFDYPFIYMVEPGNLLITDEEAPILRKYLLGGGFLMLDDFWGVWEGENAVEQLKKVFPDRELQELKLDHPIFHNVFSFKEKPQVPGISAWERSGLTYERSDAKDVDYRAIYDDKGRMMVVFCHNTDNGDGWEREAEDPEYFRLFSETMAYPWMINVIVYAMTH
jgi:hypothetical protein